MPFNTSLPPSSCAINQKLLIKCIDFHFKEDLLSDNDLFQKTPPKSPVSLGLSYAWLIPELVTHSNLFKFYSFGH